MRSLGRRVRSGRRFAPDRRDRRFRLPVRKTSGTKRWNLGPWQPDQGSTSSCVGFGWAMKLAALPLRQFVDPLGLYLLANERDEWFPEEHEGTSVRAGAKILKRLGLIEQYRWTWDLAPLISAVLLDGPMVVGTSWYAGMDDPDDDGVIEVSGSDQGGHAYLVYGVNTRAGLFDIRCAWPEFGDGGRAKIPIEALGELIADEGEACLALERKAGW